MAFGLNDGKLILLSVQAVREKLDLTHMLVILRRVYIIVVKSIVGIVLKG